MGTLFDQPPRQETLAGYMHWIRARAPEFGFSPDAMTAADWRALCVIVRTALAIQDADAQDEQLAGFGQLIGSIGDSLSDIGDSLSDIGDSLRDFNSGDAATMQRVLEMSGRQPERSPAVG
jgi:hypothetical protein